MRRMKITKGTLEVYGYAEGCPGCMHRQANLSGGRLHTEQCRTRILQAITDDDTSFGQRMRDRVRSELTRFGRGTEEFDNIAENPLVEEEAAEEASQPPPMPASSSSAAAAPPDMQAMLEDLIKDFDGIGEEMESQ